LTFCLYVQPSLGDSFSSPTSQQFERKTINRPKINLRQYKDADDSYQTVDDNDYDFVPGTPPSKKVSFLQMLFNGLLLIWKFQGLGTLSQSIFDSNFFL
jgi:hypothetical protein